MKIWAWREGIKEEEGDTVASPLLMTAGLLIVSHKG